MVYAIVILFIWCATAGILHNLTTKKLLMKIAVLERDHITLAHSLVTAKKSLVSANEEQDCKTEALNQRVLTLEGKQPKIAVKPTRMSFRQFRSAVEREQPEEDNG